MSPHPLGPPRAPAPALPREGPRLPAVGLSVWVPRAGGLTRVPDPLPPFPLSTGTRITPAVGVFGTSCHGEVIAAAGLQLVRPHQPHTWLAPASQAF